MASTSRAPATLLFCHGGGFCKGVWTPIITRLQRTRLLQQSTIVTFDLPYHGEHRDVSQHATINRENPKSVRVSHPAMNWTEWATAAVQRQVRKLPPKQGAPLIGIGHSMGAAALWATEVATPGTFDALVLFEPIVNGDAIPTMLSSIDFLVALTLKRTGQWCVPT
jgi:pimeloyl-ACP methyl ester carboxylesterase